MAKRASKHKKKKSVIHYAVWMMFLFLFVSMAAAYISNQVTISAKRAELAALNEQIDQQRAENEEISRVLSRDQDEIIEWIARDSYGYAAPNERIFVDMSGK